MRCREAKYWLYSFRPNASWPADVVGHLQQCQTCQQLHTQLKQIDAGVEKLTNAPGSSLAKDQLLDRLTQTPQDKAAPDTTPASSSWVWVRFAGYLTASAAMIAFGWFLGHQFEPNSSDTEPRIVEVIKPVEVVREKTVEVFRDKIVIVHSQPDRELFAALLKCNAELVQATQVRDKVGTLLNMAEDCQQHALTLIADGPRESLPLTIELYAQLLRDGVLVQLAQAPAEHRAVLQTTVRFRVGKMAEPTAVPVALPTVVEDQRTALYAVAVQTLDNLDHPEDMPKPVAAKKLPRTELIPTTTALVKFALAYSSEADPVVKADFCADYVQRLMPAMMLYLDEDTSPQRDEMGQQFGEMIRFGVYRPLEIVTAKQPPQKVKDQADRVFESADQTVKDMERHLEKASKGARPGIERALEATKKGTGKGAKDAGEKGPRDIQAVLRSVDRGKNTITVTAKIQGKEAERTFALTKEILKLVNAKSPKLGDLQTGMTLQLQLSEDRRTVIEIRRSKGNNGKDEGDK